MRLFTFSRGLKAEKAIDDNGWVFKSRFKRKIGYFSLKGPVKKEITYSKGTAVRYAKHTVFGIGFINDNFEFSGIALFDLHIRIFICIVITIGVAYASTKLYVGVIWAILFYILITFLSLKDDDYLLYRSKLMYES